MISAPQRNRSIVAMGIDEYQILGWALTADGTLNVFRLGTGDVLDKVNLLDGDATISSFSGTTGAPDEFKKKAALRALLKLQAKKLNTTRVTARRRLLRTGNFELTNTHFHWVADHQIALAGESEPPSALVLERVEWGRFHGLPTQFAFAHERIESDQASRLARLV
jgi:hypothetical protein